MCCLNCKNYNYDKIGICKAYPSGIPFIIESGEIDHSENIKGDHGIQYEPIEEIE